MTAYSTIVALLIDRLIPLAKGHPVNENTDLVGDLALDSLQIMDFVMALEDHFDISIPVSALSDVKTVRDLGRQIETLTSQQ